MKSRVNIIGAGLAGSECALQLAKRGFNVSLFEMRPQKQTPVHRSGCFAELVCSNSLKGTKRESAAGMLKFELRALDSFLLACADENAVPAGGALAVDRRKFAQQITEEIKRNGNIEVIAAEVAALTENGDALLQENGSLIPSGHPADAAVVATGPMTAQDMATYLDRIIGRDHLAFYDAAAPIVMAESLDMDRLFRQSRYEENEGDYLNAPFEREAYERFIEELVGAKRVVQREFETKDLFQACQPIEEIARKGADAPRFGTLKPVGLRDPKTDRRPWAVVQLRAEDAHRQSYNLVGFQTNLTFPEQQRVFSMIPGLEHAEFARFGVMHRNTFIDAPQAIDCHLRLKGSDLPLHVAGQVSGTEGYCEAIMSGAYAALAITAELRGVQMPPMPETTAFGSLLAYATDPNTIGYQPMHVNFGIMKPLDQKVKRKQERYRAYAERGERDMASYIDKLRSLKILDGRESDSAEPEGR